jgi:hypothetical protein
VPTEFENEWSKVHRTVRSRCLRAANGNRDDADDMVAEVLFRSLRSYHTFRRDSSFATWVDSITTNVINDHLRRRLRLIVESLDDPNRLEQPRDEAGYALVDSRLEFEGAIDEAVAKELIDESAGEVIRRGPRGLKQPWTKVKAELRINDPASIHSRAIKILDVFLFLEHPDIIASPKIIELAFERAKVAEVDPLTDAEVRIFSQCVLRLKGRHRTIYRDSELRSACYKVGRILRGESTPEPRKKESE